MVLSTLNVTLVGALALSAPERGPDTPWERGWVIVCISVNVLVALAWLFTRRADRRPWPQLFAIWADVGTATNILTLAAFSDMLSASVLFVVTGSFFTFFLSRRWLLVHLVFSAVFIAGVTAAAGIVGEQGWIVLIGQADVVLAAVVALPLTVQVYWGQQTRAAQLAEIDDLTDVLNRRGINAQSDLLMRRARTARHRIAVAVIDLDRFKSVNDDHGHQVGDRVLVEVAARLNAHLSPYGPFGRTGGEEFAAVLAVTASHLERIVADMPTRVQVDDLPAVTVSVGVAAMVWPGSGHVEREMRALWVIADQAMYRAKRAGGERVVTQLNGLDAQ
ncbi:GGDEF domain-containing protein [Williamsia sterculiae]|uniref:Diguanylate cyclase (GGDEF) domain-containing protein n=1 Tax=Williamsia sterculiae TaxID=1344003 RepID=A0A1N7DNT7_9NOCA|nr:GGDEF domain-containing protein [Williamsia sterculiae]SIR77398.1 diguanylate cyclase (GGDEF) domain-containing protein [Williamsia sterculiae]